MPGLEDIAVIGMNCAFPGARTLDEFWSLIVGAKQAFGSLDDRPFSNRLLSACFGLGVEAGAIQRAGVIDSVYGFDASFFRISGREARSMDPQARLLLEVTWGLLEHAGITPEELRGSRTGLSIGLSSSDFLQDIVYNLDAQTNVDVHHALGNAGSATVGRVAHHFGWMGPVQAVDTACSSSLVAISNAYDMLRLGRADLMVAGGINLILSPFASIAFMNAKMLSPDGQCRPFDARANGYVRGEGCGLVLLKRLSDAQRDNDVIHAVIRGSAVNHNGFSNGLTAPNPAAQVALISDCWGAKDKFDGPLDYIEAHGTGTSLGDPIECKALATCARDYGLERVPIGSVKSNIGHLEAAAGVAGFIKAVLLGAHEKLPPQANFETLNPLLKRYESEIYVNTTLQPFLRTQAKARIGVSSFGFSGTNAHMLLEVPAMAPVVESTEPLGSVVVGISARDRAALTRRLEQFERGVMQSPGPSFEHIVRDLQYQPHLERRTSFLVRDRSGIVSGIRQARQRLTEQDSGADMPSTRDIPLILGNADIARDPALLKAFSRYADYPLFVKHEASAGPVDDLAALPELWRFFLFLLHRQIPQVQIGRVSASAWARSDFMRTANVAVDAKCVETAEGYYLELGSSLRLMGPGCDVGYRDDPFVNTLRTLGMLYSMGVLRCLPRLQLTRPATRALPNYVFDHTRYFHDLHRTDRETTGGEPGLQAERKLPALTRYTEVWHRFDACLEAPLLHCGVLNESCLHTLDQTTHCRTWSVGTLDKLAQGGVRQFLLPISADSLEAIPAALKTVVLAYQSLQRQLQDLPFEFNILANDAGEVGAAFGGALTGFMSSLAWERPEQSGVVILADTPTVAATWDIVASILGQKRRVREFCFRIRDDHAHVKRLLPGPQVFVPDSSSLSLEGRGVLLTGAGSSISQRLIQRLLLRQPSEIVLIGRRTEEHAAIDSLRALAEQRKVKLTYVQCDIADLESVRGSLLPKMRAGCPYTLIHAAGVLGSRTEIIHLDDSVMSAAWAGKVVGLVHLLKELKITLSDAYLFSSVSAVWGWAGQAAYAMANGFLQGLSTAYQGSGPKIISQAWGVWRDSAIFEEHKNAALMSKLGLFAHSSADGVEWVMEAMAGRDGASICAAIDPALIAERSLRISGLFSSIIDTVDSPQSVLPVEKEQVVEFFIEFLKETEDLHLELPSDLYRGFFDLGFNSLLVVDLNAALNKRFGIRLSSHAMLNSQSLDMLAAHVSIITKT